MNFLKKKIKNVVGRKRNKDDDDDDFDNYVPEVPPHPSTLTDATGVASESNFANFADTFTSLTSAADSAAKTLVDSIASTLQNTESDDTEQDKGEQLSLEELKAREEEHKRTEKEKLKQQEESKKDCEDWKYFLSLTAKVDAVTSKTQTVLTKLKDESAIKDIAKVEDPCFADRYDESVPKTAGGWVAFEEQEFNPADPIFSQPEVITEPEAVEPVIDESTKQLAKELIDDFGFTNPAPGIPLWEEETIAIEEDSVDPFDTSFIDIDKIQTGKSLKTGTALLKDIDSDSKYIDPFDTTHIETVITEELVIDKPTTDDLL